MSLLSLLWKDKRHLIDQKRFNLRGLGSIFEEKQEEKEDKEELEEELRKKKKRN
jgi:ABC-type enterochelin transport system substrate-binding protein